MASAHRRGSVRAGGIKKESSRQGGHHQGVGVGACSFVLYSILAAAFIMYTEKNNGLQGTVFWGPEVSLSAQRDRNQTKHRTRSVHFLWVLNEICQHFEDHIKDSQSGQPHQGPNMQTDATLGLCDKLKPSLI